MALSWKVVRVRGEIYRLIKKMGEVEHRSLANMVEECVLYYFSRKHKDLKVVD